MVPADDDVSHFEAMIALARALKELPAQILEYRYAPESFGSWLVVVRHDGVVSMVTLDGKDGYLGIRRSSDLEPPFNYGEERTVAEGARPLTPEVIHALCDWITQRPNNSLERSRDR